MALDNNQPTQSDSYGTKLTVIGGRWTLRCADGTPGSEQRELTKGDNAGTTVSEMKYTALSGHISGGRIVDGNFGKSADVDLTDLKTGERYTVNFPLDSRYLFDFIKRLPNMDCSKDVRLEIVPHKTKRTMKGNPVYSLHAVQYGAIIPDHYVEWKRDGSGKPKANTVHGMPDAIHGARGWSFEAQEDWLIEKFIAFFEDYIAPTGDTDFAGIPVATASTSDAVRKVEEAMGAGKPFDGDEVPF